jgi:hypothetical protein
VLEHLFKFLTHTLNANALKHIGCNNRTYGLSRSTVHNETLGNAEPKRTKDTKPILANALEWVSHETKQTTVQIRLTVEWVNHLAVNVHRHSVHGEITSGQIVPKRARLNEIRPASVATRPILTGQHEICNVGSLAQNVSLRNLSPNRNKLRLFNEDMETFVNKVGTKRSEAIRYRNEINVLGINTQELISHSAANFKKLNSHTNFSCDTSACFSPRISSG